VAGSQTPEKSQKTQQRKPYLTLAGGVLAANDPENETKKTPPLSDQTGVTFFHQKQKGKDF